MQLRRIACHLALTTALLASAGCGSESPTPPDDDPTPTPIALRAGQTVGRSVFPVGNSSRGGQGQPIGGVGCITGPIAYHHHIHVSLFVRGEQIAIPAGVGITNPVLENGYVARGGCFYWIHTHDATGILHVEPPTVQVMTLGHFFAVWGQPLSRSNVAGFEGTVTAYVNGSLYNGDLGAIPFGPHMLINLQVGEPRVVPPVYTFPSGY